MVLNRPLGPDWWQASNGCWYPPEQWTGPPGSAPSPSAAERGWRIASYGHWYPPSVDARVAGSKAGRNWAVGTVVLLLLLSVVGVGLVLVATAGDHGDSESAAEASDSSAASDDTTATMALPPSPPLPPVPPDAGNPSTYRIGQELQRRAYAEAIADLDGEDHERLCLRVRTEGIDAVVNDMLSDNGAGHPDIVAAAVLDSCR